MAANYILCKRCGYRTSVRDDFDKWLNERLESKGDIRHDCNNKKCNESYFGSAEIWVETHLKRDKNGCGGLVK